jgi:hypothetical protein
MSATMKMPASTSSATAPPTSQATNCTFTLVLPCRVGRGAVSARSTDARVGMGSIGHEKPAAPAREEIAETHKRAGKWKGKAWPPTQPPDSQAARAEWISEGLEPARCEEAPAAGSEGV